MGDYTSIRAILTVDDEFVPVIRALMTEPFEWKAVAEAFPQYGFIAEYAKLWRVDFIPFGASCYTHWKDSETGGPWARRLEGHYWTFQCSVKNYEGEIDAFLKMAKHMITRVNVLFSKFEYDDRPEKLHLKGVPEDDYNIEDYNQP